MARWGVGRGELSYSLMMPTFISFIGHYEPIPHKKVHKVHHRAFAPFPLEYIYVHPLEWMFGALAIPVGLGCISRQWFNLRSRILGLRIWRNFHEIDIHSGLRSSLGTLIPFYGTNEHHDRQYEKDPRKLCLDVYHLGPGSQNLHPTDFLMSK